MRKESKREREKNVKNRREGEKVIGGEIERRRE